MPKSERRQRYSEPLRFEHFYNRVVRLVIGCLKDTVHAHGELLASSAAKRIASALWAQLKPGTALADLLPREPGQDLARAGHLPSPTNRPLMTDRHMPIQDYLIHALAGLGEQAGLEDQERLWQTGNAGVRIEGVNARARHADLRLNGLRMALTDNHAEVRKEALELLREGPYHPELTAEVAECLANDRSHEVRAEAFELVTTLPPDECFVPGLAAFLAHSDRTTRHRAAHHIRRTASQDAAQLRPVLQMLEHAEAPTRNLAQKALRYPNRVREVLDALLARLQAADPQSRHLLSPTLACCQDRERLRDELRKALESDNRDVAVSAAYAMAWCGDRDLRPDLETLLYSENNLYSCAAILGLEIMDAKDMVSALRAMLGNDAPPDTDEDDYPDTGPDGDG